MSEAANIAGSLALEQTTPIVKVIEATNASAPDRLRVAAYARVSSDSDDQLNSFAAQVRHYNDLIQSENDWVMVDVYADEGISGTSTKKRDDFNRMMNDCRRGQIDIVLCKSLSRFARNAVDCLEALRELKRLGITVRFEKENLDTTQMRDETITAFYATFAQQESESISGNMRWSYQRRMQSGTYITSSVPYGYCLKDKVMVVVEDQAVIVRRIVNDYLAGKNMYEIAAELTNEQVRRQNGRTTWNRTTIDYILRNERYIGDMLLQKTFATDTLPYKQKKNRGERNKYYVTNAHVPIIDREQYDRVQMLRDSRQEYVDRSHSNTKYPLSSMLICESCGSAFQRKICHGRTFWVCGKHRKGMGLCDAPQIPETEIYCAFIHLYNKLKANYNEIIAPLTGQLQLLNRNKMLWSKELIELTSQIADISEQDRKLNGMKATQNVDPAYFIRKSTELANKLHNLKLEKERLLSERSDTTLEDAYRLAELLKAGPAYISEFDTDLFAGLVQKIVVEGQNQLRFQLLKGLQFAERIERMTR